MAVTPSILGLSRWNNNWNARNSHSYVPTATKIRFHFQFPRLPGAAFGGGWLLDLKYKFGWRIISNMANHVKCNYFSHDDGIDNVTLRLLKLSDFCPRHTVGVAGDYIMYHILVAFSIHFASYQIVHPHNDMGLGNDLRLSCPNREIPDSVL